MHERCTAKDRLESTQSRWIRLRTTREWKRTVLDCGLWIYQMCRSEEDNDPLTDDGIAHSAASLPIPISRHPNINPTRPSHLKPKRHLLLSDSDGVDSPTYDGDIESSTTAGLDTPAHKPTHHHHHHHHEVQPPDPETPLSSVFAPSSPNTPHTEPLNPLSPTMRPVTTNSHLPVFISPPINTTAAPLLVTEEPAVAAASKEAFNPAALTPDDIQTFVAKAVKGEDHRNYKINPPPQDRPVRIYADGLSFFPDPPFPYVTC